MFVARYLQLVKGTLEVGNPFSVSINDRGNVVQRNLTSYDLRIGLSKGCVIDSPRYRLSDSLVNH